MYFSEDSSTTTDIDAEYASSISSEPHFPTKKELDDLIRDLGLTKSGAELSTSRLTEWNLLGDNCKSTAYRNGNLKFSVYFDVIENLCYCKDVEGLLSVVGIDHDSIQWRLFIDSSTKSLKAMLLHKDNIYPSIPLAYSLQTKEDYKNVKQLLIKINYAQFKWYVCGNFKILGVLLGLQSGYTKYFCFLCSSNSRADGEHYEKMHWPTPEELTPGMCNVIREPLVSREKFLLPPLHTKLDLVKQFAKALDFEEVFQEIRSMFARLSHAKIKGGIFVGAQISIMLKPKSLEAKINETEKEVWQVFRGVVNGFLENKGN